MKLVKSRYLLVMVSVGVAPTYFSAENNYSLVHLRGVVYTECTSFKGHASDS